LSLAYERVLGHFERLKLKRVSELLDPISEQATKDSLSYVDFLDRLREAEASSRAEREQAEETIRSTAEQLAQALLREAETQGYAQPPRSPSMASRKPKLRRAICSRNSPMPCSHPARLASASSTGSRTPKARRVSFGPG